MRRAARVDRNHASIVKALRGAGCGVLDMSPMGKGVPDLLVHAPTFPACRTPVFLEVKDSKQPPSKRKLTPQQLEFHAAWKGYVFVVTTPDEALAAMGVLPKADG